MPSVLPQARFCTQTLSSQDRYEAWRGLISAVFEPTPPAGRSASDLHAELSCTHFGQAMITDVAAGAQHFTRTRRLIAKEGLDHYIVQVYRFGVCEGTYGEVTNTIQPGDVKIIDLAQPFNTFNTDFSNISLVLPRAIFAPLLDRPDSLHGTILHRASPFGRIVAAHVRELAAITSRLSFEEGAAIAASSARLIAACLGANTRRADELRSFRQAAIARAIRDFIEENLASALLTPDFLARRFRLSRAHLYRLFDQEDGIAAYIQARRLRHCFLAITDPDQTHRRIGDIAHDMGFSSESHFSHAFRRAYGVSPSEARASATAYGQPRHATFINDWMRDLRPIGEMRQPDKRTACF